MFLSNQNLRQENTNPSKNLRKNGRPLWMFSLTSRDNFFVLIYQSGRFSSKYYQKKNVLFENALLTKNKTEKRTFAYLKRKH